MWRLKVKDIFGLKKLRSIFHGQHVRGSYSKWKRDGSIDRRAGVGGDKSNLWWWRRWRCRLGR
jgi:hypothetical protein